MKKRLVLPCLRGYLGSWTTYTCMMRLKDAAKLIGFAHELHRIEKLSDNIQRELGKGRPAEIAEYLLQDDDRFFNSLVVAVYDGDPNWHEVGGFTPNTEEAALLNFPEYAQNCLGFLSINGEEKLFALDGQHRLAGIKAAIEKSDEIGDELINVIIVAHKNTPAGIVKSRRLFTTLNKKAKLVSKDTIIALDEDDISACITRKLIESSDFEYFNENIISFNTGPVRDKTSITSIVNIYDNVQKLVAFKLGVKESDLERYRYRDNEAVYEFVSCFFRRTFEGCPELLNVAMNGVEAGYYRNSETGGHLLFRPIGWDVYTDVYLFLVINCHFTSEHAIHSILKKDLNLSGDLLINKVWSKAQKKILKVSAKSMKAIMKAVAK
ncbi:DGQHR domain-containing protein [Escherichia coli]|nr:DGQHR domain-containing protein [Escherichia coli]MBB8525512.1 DGQHR domain-containing protein [Escherichia coli]MDF1201714.1 DNA sulfur modification protein DndB [Escherichia coli]HAW3779261.1 DGQHR domain-containing protein [Escherichia coli]HAX5136920.1 DGQHR domain-containing protein [Escherichia coli]